MIPWRLCLYLTPLFTLLSVPAVARLEGLTLTYIKKTFFFFNFLHVRSFFNFFPSTKKNKIYFVQTVFRIRMEY